jgi:hypothetical protein
MMRLATAVLASFLFVSACGARAEGRGAGGGRAGEARGARGGGKDGDKETETRVTKQGNKTTTTTVTKRRVEAAPLGPRPADPFPADPLVRFNVERINDYRKQHGVGPVVYDAKISAFALRGSQQLATEHVPHGHFNANVKAALGDPDARKGKSGFGMHASENQGDPRGVSQLDADPSANAKKQINLMLKMMHDEGPGGGHYENMLDPKSTRVGVGLLSVGGKLYLTNDFSD